MIISAHVKAQGGVFGAFASADELGVKSFQSFASAPSNWYFRQSTDEEINTYVKRKNEGNYGPIFFHGIYLLNFASTNPDLIAKSNESIINYLNLSAKLKIDGVIFHIGSTKEQNFADRKSDLIKNLQYVLAQSDPKSILVFENSAGAGGTIGKKIEEFEQIWEGLKKFQERIRFCFDTCHAFASGYDFRTIEGINKLKQDLDKSIGKQNVIALHVNDSKGELGANRDRHDNIGEGKIGMEGFKLLAKDEFFNSLPWILEVPGFDNKGPDKQNIAILESLNIV